jgi:exopolyphosphatase/pppGpp-phosphohydrolase
LTDRFLFHDPPTTEELLLARSEADQVVGKIRLDRPGPVEMLLLAGGAGQFLDELAVALWQQRLSLASLPQIQQVLANRTSYAITELLDISQQRARVLPGGLQIALTAIAMYQPHELVAVPSGIRMGLLKELAAVL